VRRRNEGSERRYTGRQPLGMSSNYMSTTYTPSELARIQASVDSRRFGPFSSNVIIPEDTPQDDLGDLDGAEIIDGVPLWFPPEEAEFPEPDMPDEEMEVQSDDETDDENDLPTITPDGDIPTAYDEHMTNLYRHYYMSDPIEESYVNSRGHHVIPGTQREMQGLDSQSQNAYAREIREESQEEARQRQGGTIQRRTSRGQSFNRRGHPIAFYSPNYDSTTYTPSELQRIQANIERRRIHPGRLPRAIPPDTLPWYQQIHEDEDDGEPLYDDVQNDDEQEDADEEIIEEINEVPDSETLLNENMRNFDNANARDIPYRVTSRGHHVIPYTQGELRYNDRELINEVFPGANIGGAIYNPNNDPGIAAQNEVIRRNMQGMSGGSAGGPRTKKRITPEHLKQLDGEPPRIENVPVERSAPRTKKRITPVNVVRSAVEKKMDEIRQDRTRVGDAAFAALTNPVEIVNARRKPQANATYQNAVDKMSANILVAHDMEKQAMEEAMLQRKNASKEPARKPRAAAAKKRRSTACDLRGYSKLKKAELVGALKNKLTAEKMPDNIGKLSVVKLRALAREYCGYKKVSRK